MRNVALACLVALSACREVPPPFEVVDPAPDSAQGIRLTYSLGRDRAPFWSMDSDTVYYTAEGVFPPLPATQGALVGISPRGGKIGVLLPGQQIGVNPLRFLAGGAVSPDGKSVAYFEIKLDRPDTMDCKNFCTINDTLNTQPMMIAAAFRITPADEGPSADTVTVPISGRYWDPTHQHYGLMGAWVFSAHPFQRLILSSGAQPFRASWSPDGKRVVYSDGLQLYIYDTATRKSTKIPGTYDGIYATWSPKGDMIAYSRPLRSDSISAECLCVNLKSGAVAREERRIVYNMPTLGSGALIVIKPDGSELRVIGPGDMPSWLPDGEGLVFRRGLSLWRASANGTEAQAIPFTNNAEEPAVSPDGRRVAFVRSSLGLNGEDAFNAGDIWVVPLRVGQ